jgi:hypothetical protein
MSTARQTVDGTRTTSGWTGWVGFAAVILFVSGIFSVIQGLVAIIGPNAYYVKTNGNLFALNVAGWGWWNLIVGVLLVVAGGALFAGQTWARVVAIILAVLSGISQLLLVPAQPWWSLIVIALDILIIYAVTAHGGELREDTGGRDY